MSLKNIIVSYFSRPIREIIFNLNDEIIEKTEEIRIRINKPLFIKSNSKEYFVNNKGIVQNELEAFIVSSEDIKQTVELISNYSIYAFEQELKQGFITLPGGFRVGIAGKTITDNKHIKTIKNISSLNFRISHEIKGCAEKVIKYIKDSDFKHTLIISPPNCGKTTLLRDIIRITSNYGYNVGVADERSEIAGSYMGANQNDVGIRTDILDGCPKAEGMTMILRSLSPDIIAADEIGNQNDIEAIHNIVNSGIKLICTIHGESIEDVKSKPLFKNIIENNVFERYIILSRKNGVGTVESIYGKNFNKLEF